MLTRRQMLVRSAYAASLAAVSPLTTLFAATPGRKYKIGACDWSIGRMATPTAFALAKEIGLDGVQVSLGTAADDMKLRQRAIQQEFLAASKEQGVAIASLAIGELNNIPYKSDPRTEAWVADSVDAMSALGVKVILLAFFGKGDLAGDAAGVDEVVRRLKRAAPRAEKAGVVFGLESWLSAEDTMRIMDRVGSPSVKMYYDVRNSSDRGYDIIKEIRWLGAKNICEFHMKENGCLLGKGSVDFRKVRDVIGEIGYEGWMQIEGAVPPKGQLKESYIQNRTFLRDLFPA